MTLNFVLSLDKARRQARVLLGAVATGRDPLAEQKAEEARAKNTLLSVAEEYLRHEGKALRSLKRRRSIFDRLIYPRLGMMPIADIRRSDVVRLLDEVAEVNGPVQADVVYRILRRLFSWWAVRDETFPSPMVRGMRGRHAKQRDRVLSDDELRAFWRATARGQLFDQLLRFLLLTAVRRNEASGMCRDEVADGVWVIPARRMKGGAEHVIPLSCDAQRLLAGLPFIGKAGWVFTHDGKAPISNFSRPMADLRRRCGIGEDWVLHDLRRTARSLMSRGGVLPDVAERALAHAIGGVRGVYDRHSYHAEKKHAFETLAAEIRRIVEPPAANVVPLHGGG
jgi:integrase